jgi:hypothetical protein
MHWVSTFLALALTGALQVEASDATILTFSPGTEDSLSIRPKQQTLSEDEARLVLELRMQSSVASVLGMVDADTVDHLNQFAEAGSTLFGGSSGAQTPGKSVLILEGVDQQNSRWNLTSAWKTLADFRCSCSSYIAKKPTKPYYCPSSLLAIRRRRSSWIIY